MQKNNGSKIVPLQRTFVFLISITIFFLIPMNQPVFAQPAPDQLAFGQLVLDGPTTELTAPGQEASEQPTSERSATDQPAAEQSTPNPSAPGQPDLEQPAPNKTDLEQPASNPSAPGQPVSPQELMDIKGHWAEAQIRKYSAQGILLGFADGSFQPDRAVTRAELIATINRFFNLTETTEISFADVPENAWYRKDLEIAVKAGYVAGNHNGNFGADVKVTRQEAAVIIAKKMGFVPSAENNEADRFDDGAEIPGWSRTSINVMIHYGIMQGYPDNLFRYNGTLTRAEMLSVLDSLSEHINGDNFEE